jgi:hypothetical protein
VTLRDLDAPTAMRKRVGHDLQTLKHNLWHARLCPAFGALAERINQAADGPVLDGLTLAALAYVLASNPTLAVLVSVMVEQIRATA